jgi:flagellar biosynthesis protein FlhG
MKRITDQNYYELLEISPRASTQEVQWAYDQAMDLFSADSIATYSLLSEKDRELILARIVEAYKTLTNGYLREEYNQGLLERGEILPEDLASYSSEEPAVSTGNEREIKLESSINKETPMDSPEDTVPLFNLDSVVTGKDIQELRISRDLSIDDIHGKTNVPRKTLRDIEEERFDELPALVYLKGFLKTYAKVLNVDESQMVDGYVQRFLEWKTSFQR